MSTTRIRKREKPLTEFWDTVHMLIWRDRHELIDRMEFANGFERRAKLDPFRNAKSNITPHGVSVIEYSERKIAEIAPDDPNREMLRSFHQDTIDFHHKFKSRYDR